MLAEVSLDSLPFLIADRRLRMLGFQRCSAHALIQVLTDVYFERPIAPLQLREAEHDSDVWIMPGGEQLERTLALVDVVAGREPYEMLFELAAQVFEVEAMPNRDLTAPWIDLAAVLRSTSDGPFLIQAGVNEIADPRFDIYTKRLAKLRDIKNYCVRCEIDAAPSQRLRIV